MDEGKKSEKHKYQEKLDGVVHMKDSVRKVLQEEINGLENKNDVDMSKKINYLN